MKISRIILKGLVGVIVPLLQGCGVGSETYNITNSNVSSEYAAKLDPSNNLYVSTPIGKQVSFCTSTQKNALCSSVNASPLKLHSASGNQAIFFVGNVTNPQGLYVSIIDQTSQKLLQFTFGKAGNNNSSGSSSSTTQQSGEYTGGGSPGSQELTFRSSTRQSSFRVNAPASNGASSANGLLIYLHGDGAGDYSWFWSKLQPVAKKYNLIPVSVLTPDSSSRTWYRDGAENAKFLHELIQKELYTKYNVEKSKVYFTGASGGPQFLTGQFIPLYGNNYQGGAVPMCGGGGPSGYGRWVKSFQPSEAFKNGFKIFYHTGTADFLYNQVRDSLKFYSSLGVKTDGKFPSGVSHCNFAMEKALDAALQVITN